MRAFLLLILFIPVSCFANSSDKTDSLLKVLKTELGKSDEYLSKKELHIKKLKESESKINKDDYQAQFTLANWLYDEYKSYQFDSAYVYVNKMINISKRINYKPKEYYSEVKLSFILLSSGLFNETFRVLGKVDFNKLEDSVKSEYYFLMGRSYYDLAYYNHDKYFTPSYIKTGNRYLDSAIYFSVDNATAKTYYIGLQKLQEGEFEQGAYAFQKLLRQGSLISMHLRAMVACSLGEIYIKSDQQQDGLNMTIESAIADVRSSTRETVALYTLAGLLYKQGSIEDAYQFIKLAKADADFYGARQRKIQIGSILPLIAAEEINNSEHQKNKILIYLLIITSLAILVVIFLVLMFNQLNKVKTKEKIIEDKNVQLEYINDKLLEDTNIKEEYIGQFFKEISGYILKLEKLKMTVGTKLSMKKYEDINELINKIDIKNERASLYYSFDHIFIKIFPNFIFAFNSLFEKKDQSWPHENELLNTDLRIYALIRIGINDDDTIAKILEYSVNTIYVYKMRIKARAIDHENFDKQIMAIKAFDFDKQT
ncbi:DUF6377 domain-containing protein [Mucilaginibacter sp.]|uniref:DUF6377 domain-containing protein n=1 Tax=Mucilaginibacter sp. TaxID=1882438 RepID=UPI0025DE56D0|nr:DUF6377 domain-containing protein [Mucilaginibacter sp.]